MSEENQAIKDVTKFKHQIFLDEPKGIQQKPCENCRLPDLVDYQRKVIQVRDYCLKTNCDCDCHRNIQG